MSLPDIERLKEEEITDGEDNLAGPVEAELNQIVSAVNDDREQINTNESQIDIIDDRVSINTNAISVNATGIDTNVTGISENDTELTAHDTRIDTLESAVGVGQLVVFHATVDSVILGPLYEEYNCIYCNYTGETTVQLVSVGVTNPAGRHWYIVPGPNSTGVKVYAANWMHYYGTTQYLYVEPGQVLHLGLMDNQDDPWTVLSIVEPPIPVERQDVTADVTLTEYSRKKQYIEIDQARNCVMPAITSYLDGMIFTIICGADSSVDLTVQGSGTDEVWGRGGKIGASGEYPLKDGEAIQLVASYDNMVADAALNKWIVLGSQY